MYYFYNSAKQKSKPKTMIVNHILFSLGNYVDL